MSDQEAKFKPGDILYCHLKKDRHLIIPSCDCVVQVLSRWKPSPNSQEGPGYNVQPLSHGPCGLIHDNCCARNAIKVSRAFAEYLGLFKQ